MADRVKAGIADLSPELQRAARWVVAHPTELSMQSMRQSAHAAGVLPVTMTRFARALGYGGFDELRHALREEVVRTAGENFSLRARKRSSSPLGQAAGTLAELAEAQTHNIASILRHNPVAAIERAADSVLKARSVLFLGMRASFGIAFQLHYSCQLILPHTSLATNQAGTVADQVWRLGRGDLLVVVSVAPYTRQTVDLALQARQQGAGVLALTDSELGPLGQCASQTLALETDSPSFFHSMTGVLAMAEALVAIIAVRGGDPVARQLAENKKRLKRMQAYWDRLPPQH
ncbi:MAG: MurR/RpiR family transcriptional regulator [Hylemonella sp.]|nr:MurR/RpiR family transcriptional regulator [Hylemonella sp.]